MSFRFALPLGLLLLAWSPSLRAEEDTEPRRDPKTRQWDPHWQTFGVGNYVLTAIGIGVTAGATLVPAPAHPWQSPNELDEWGRDHIGASSLESGEWAQDTSDLLLSLNLAFPILVDSLIVSYGYRRSPEVAKQTSLIAIESMAVASMFQGAAAAGFARERPYGRDCSTALPEEYSECAKDVRYRSFFSGHTTLAFASATVTCTFHAHHELFGNAAWDATACGATLANAATIGVLRIVAMKHYITDVATGALVGTLSGLGVPWLLHYGPLARVEPDGTSSLSLTLYPLPNGIAVGGIF